MDGKMLMVLVLGASISMVFSSPLQVPAQNFDANIPKCMQPVQNGLCLAYFPSYYYNPSKGTCEEFIYGGCGGNSNRFLTFTSCMDECGGFKLEEKEFKLVTEPSIPDPCSLPSLAGPCRANMPRFYFNGDKCDMFMYGGCEGNENNFKSAEECRQKCGPNSSEETEIEAKSEVKSEEVSDSSSEESEVRPEGESEVASEGHSEVKSEEESEEQTQAPSEVAANE